MAIVKIMWCNILCAVLSSAGGSDAIEKFERSSSTKKALDIFPGFRLTFRDDEVRVKFNLEQMLPVTEGQTRALDKGHHDEDEKKKKGNMKKLGAMVMMIPLIMQMLSVPVAIASIKMSLLKSIFVGKLAVLVMLYNLLKSQVPVKTKTIVVHSAPQHHDHFYPHLHEDSDENDKGWFGSFG